jgi:hypothetical protein
MLKLEELIRSSAALMLKTKIPASHDVTAIGTLNYGGTNQEKTVDKQHAQKQPLKTSILAVVVKC